MKSLEVQQSSSQNAANEMKLLKNENELLYKSNESIKDDCSKLQNTVNEYEKKMKEIQVQIDPLSNKIREKDVEISNLSNQILTIKDENNRLRNRVGDLSLKYNQIDPTEYESLQSKYHQLEIQLETNKTEFEKLNETLSILNNTVAEVFSFIKLYLK